MTSWRQLAPLSFVQQPARCTGPTVFPVHPCWRDGWLDSRKTPPTAQDRYNTPHPPCISWPFRNLSSALTIETCIQSLSASEYTATVLTPNFFAVRMIRHAISPLTVSVLFSGLSYLLAMRILSKRGFEPSFMEDMSGNPPANDGLVHDAEDCTLYDRRKTAAFEGSTGVARAVPEVKASLWRATKR